MLGSKEEMTDETGEATESQRLESELKHDTAKKLVSLFMWTCKIGFPFLGVAVLLALIIPLRYDDLPAKILTAKLTFATVGLLFSILEVFLGIVLALIGVTANYDLDASTGPARLKLASASPGVLLIIVGTILFGFSLVREFDVRTTTTEIPAAKADASEKRFEVPKLEGVKGPK